MTIYNATIYRTDTNKQIIAGYTSKKTKMQMFRQIQAHGEIVVELFDDCGNFDFVWNKASKVWEFFNEGSEKVGFAKFEIDEEKALAKAQRHYLEQLAAYEAQQRMEG